MKCLGLVLIPLFFAIFSFSQDFSLTHDGMTRTYRLHIPEGYNPDSLYPLVINMHGLGSNAFEQEFYSEFNQVSDSAGIVVVYPNGINETWNVSSETGINDVGFISVLIDTIDLSYSIDLNRVYATGMSMGGFMSYRLACELSDRIAAIASVTGLQAYYPCNPARPVPVAQFHGTADPVVPYAGVPSTISNWVNYNTCPDSAVITDLPDIDTTDNSTVTVSYYGPCSESTEVILYTIINGGHTWPGASLIIGTTNQDIDASVEIWDFFSRFTLEGATSVNDNPEETTVSFNVYPNPVSGYVTVHLNAQQSSRLDFKIFSMTGESVMELNDLGSVRFVIDCRGIPAGFYIAQVTSGKWKSFLKIIIN